MSSPVFYQNALQVLCNIASGTVPGGQALTPLPPAQGNASGTTSEILAENLLRKGLILVNTSTTDRVSLLFGTDPAVLDFGVTLEPNGGAFNMDNFCFSTNAVQAITPGSAVLVAIQEYV